MNQKLAQHFEIEINSFLCALKEKRIDDAWIFLERAHILGQFFWKEHFYIHYQMFVLSLRTFNLYEAVGQIPRLILAVPGSLFKKAPTGNVGTIRVGIFEPMPIPEDLKKILESSQNSA